MLPALVEGLSLVHPVPVAKAPTVPVVAEVSVLVAEVATVTASWLKLRRRERSMIRKCCVHVWNARFHHLSYLAVVTAVPPAVHVAASSSAHVPSVHGTSSAHGASPGAHVSSHGSASVGHS